MKEEVTEMMTDEDLEVKVTKPTDVGRARDEEAVIRVDAAVGTKNSTMIAATIETLVRSRHAAHAKTSRGNRLRGTPSPSPNLTAIEKIDKKATEVKAANEARRRGLFTYICS